MKIDAPYPKEDRDLRLVRLICLALAFGVLLCYRPVCYFGYVNLDDPIYVYQNPTVQKGLSWAGVKWSFTSVKDGNWAPLVWLSHMADCEIYGIKAGGHHVTNVLLHCASALLLFLVLKEMTGAIWRSGFVAAIFAWHPLHVESVAWIAERKDVLSALFWLLTMWAFVRFTKAEKTKRKKYYIWALVFFALGLMSKSMLVSLPVVLLMLDYWPLKRMDNGQRIIDNVVEKLPMFALSAIAGVVTLLAQKSVDAVGTGSFPLRLENALVSYVVYLGKMLWPVRLAVFYPYPRSIPLWQAAGAGLALVVISLVVAMETKRRRYLGVGWAWYLVTLLPVIGLVQAGLQARADRYTYIPSIGLALMISWGHGRSCCGVASRPNSAGRGGGAGVGRLPGHSDVAGSLLAGQRYAQHPRHRSYFQQLCRRKQSRLRAIGRGKDRRGYATF